MKARAAPTTTDADAAFPEDANARTVNENSPAGTNVGDPVAAMDTQDDVLTYSLTGANTGMFMIDPATGQITVGPKTMLDHEATPSYTDVMVSVIGAGGGTAEIPAVTITVRDVNEAPMMIMGVTMLKLAEYDADTDPAIPANEDERGPGRAKTVSTYASVGP